MANATPHKSISMLESLSVLEAYEFWVEEHPKASEGRHRDPELGLIHADCAGNTVSRIQSTNQMR